jgi:hypothetical protein
MGKKLSRCILPDALGTAKENRMSVGRCKKFRVSGSSRDHRAESFVQNIFALRKKIFPA